MWNGYKNAQGGVISSGNGGAGLTNAYRDGTAINYSGGGGGYQFSNGAGAHGGGGLGHGNIGGWHGVVIIRYRIDS